MAGLAAISQYVVPVLTYVMLCIPVRVQEGNELHVLRNMQQPAPDSQLGGRAFDDAVRHSTAACPCLACSRSKRYAVLSSCYSDSTIGTGTSEFTRCVLSDAAVMQMRRVIVY